MALVVLGRLIVEVPRSLSDTPPSVETSGRVIGRCKDLYLTTHTTFTTDTHAYWGLRTRNPNSKPLAADLRL